MCAEKRFIFFLEHDPVPEKISMSIVETRMAKHMNILIKKECLEMKQAKQSIGYWCEEIRRGNALGEGICIAVLDTGICAHPDFGNRILGFRDFVHRKEELYDDSGHGTHVAGILAGDGRLSNGVYAGMAPRATLLIGKVLDQEGNGSVETVLEGIRWILSVRKQYSIRIVNISVGAKPDLEQKQKKRLVLGAESLWDAGITVVASAGNDGPQKGSVASPGDSRKIITVGAYEEIRRGKVCTGQRWKYSGRGPSDACIVKPDLVAPGLGIISCGRIHQEKKAYVEKSGTSMAAPIVSGAAACLLSEYPDMTNVEVKLRLRESCTALNEEGTGWGLLDMGAFL